MAPPPLRPLSTGEVLDVSFGLYRSIFPTLFVVTAVTWAIPSVIAIFFAPPGAIFRHLILYAGSVVISVSMGSLGLAAVTRVVSNSYLGRQITAVEALRSSIPLIGRVFLISTMTLLILFFGFGFFFFPGLIAISGLCLSTVVAVIEDQKATTALDRSWALTKGYRMKALAVILVPGFLAFFVPGAAVLMLILVAGYNNPIVLMVLMGVLRVFFYPFLYVVLAVLYYDLRVRKEGFDLEVLATALQPA